MFSLYFSKHEFERSKTAKRLRIDNSLTHMASSNIQYLVDNLLHPLRKILMRPIHIKSGYRCPELNTAVRGSATSAHMIGQAADIKVDGMSAEELATYIVHHNLPFDQMVWYDVPRGGHVHISLSKPSDARQVLHAPKSGGYVRWSVK